MANVDAAQRTVQTPVGPFASDCSNEGLRREIRKLYPAIFKGAGPKEGAYWGSGVRSGGPESDVMMHRKNMIGPRESREKPHY